MDFKYSAGDNYVQDVTVRQQPISGLVSSVFFLFGMPGIFFLLGWLQQEYIKDSMAGFPAGLAFFLTGIAVVWWAGGIVTCASQMARYHSKTAEFGLFLFLISPFAWWGVALLGLAAVISQLYT